LRLRELLQRGVLQWVLLRYAVLHLQLLRRTLLHRGVLFQRAGRLLPPGAALLRELLLSP
jgi:hypothetical protein